jgi:cytochrome c
MKRLVLWFFLAAIAIAQTRPDPSLGNEIFDEQCRSCHYSDSIERKVGPGLKWLYSKDKLDSNGKPVTDASVLEKINNGGKTMPAYKDTLREEDKLNLLAFLKTL